MIPRALLDANLAILLVVGLVDRKSISGHKRLKRYDPMDFDLPCAVLEKFDGILFTPNVLTETSNLAFQSAEQVRPRIADMLAQLVAASRETFVPSQTACQRPEFARLGLADCALLEAATSDATTLVTDNFQLYATALRQAVPVLNFTHLRAQRSDFA